METVLILTFLVSVIIVARLFNVYKNRVIILCAIYAHRIDRFDRGYLTAYCHNTDMETYESTLFRFWDWGYKNILPVDKFGIIEQYINKDSWKDW